MWRAGTREERRHPPAPDRLEREVLLSLEVEPCVFLERLNRFVGLVKLDGREERAHITNTGRLYDILVPGASCLVTRINGKKLKYRIIGVALDDYYAIIDTLMQMKVFELSVNSGRLFYFAGCRVASRSPKIGRSVLDYKLECNSSSVLVEVKSAVLRGPRDEAMYPDCPTLRGRRHVMELMRLASNGLRVALVMIAAFPGAKCFMPYKEGDPVIYDLIGKAYLSGIDIRVPSYFMDEHGLIYMSSPDISLCPWWLDSIR